MNQLPKYTWLIETIRRAGKISHKDLSDKWQRHKELSDCRPLHRATFNRWREAIYDQFSIVIECQKIGGYLYYIANPQDIDEDKLKKWMLDISQSMKSFPVGIIRNRTFALCYGLSVNFTAPPLRKCLPRRRSCMIPSFG